MCGASGHTPGSLYARTSTKMSSSLTSSPIAPASTGSAEAIEISASSSTIRSSAAAASPSSRSATAAVSSASSASSAPSAPSLLSSHASHGCASACSAVGRAAGSTWSSIARKSRASSLKCPHIGCQAAHASSRWRPWRAKYANAASHCGCPRCAFGFTHRRLPVMRKKAVVPTAHMSAHQPTEGIPRYTSGARCASLAVARRRGTTPCGSAGSAPGARSMRSAPP
mmetsp:Transcript_25312/g.88342  ORF Transcript_25312/g.88342 Transcript_25312/m.88342 type:complete len:226 (+) Transcript_25312:60-737(+)